MTTPSLQDGFGKLKDSVAGLARTQDDIARMARKTERLDRRLRLILWLVLADLVLTVFVLGVVLGARGMG